MELGWDRRAGLAAVVIVALNAVAHFLPPERASVAPDDYAHVASLRRAGVPAALEAALANRQRPINLLFLVWQAKAVGVDAQRGLLLLFASSTVLALAAFAFLSAFLEARALGFLAAVLYLVVPSSVEIHHTAIFANIDLAIALYALSGAAFLRHVRRPRRSLLAISLLCYAVAVAWYEVGFFLPVLLWLVARQRERVRESDCLPFFAVAAAAILYRLTAPSPGVFDHAVGFNLRPLVTLVDHYLGTLLLRTLAYGVYCFTRIPLPWMAAAIVLDVLLIAAVLRLLRVRSGEPSHAPSGTVGLAVIAFLVFLAPMFLQARGGIAGRHLALPSLAVATVAAHAIGLHRKRLVAALVGVGLIVAQGNAWAQVGACRLNRALFETLQAKAPELALSARVVLDLRSFVDAIPSTWVPLPFDLLNTYYGAQAFEEWGTREMVWLAAGDRPVHFAVERPRPSASGGWLFQEGEALGSRGFSVHLRELPRDGTLVIGYRDVFPTGFERWRPGR